MPSLNNFSDFFFQKIAMVATFQKITQLEFESNLKKENTEKVKLEKL